MLTSLVVIACTRKVAPPTAINEKEGEAAKEKSVVVAGQKTDEPVVDPDAEKTKPPTSEPMPEQPVLPPSTPKSPEKPSLADAGKTIYNTRCNKCHTAKTIRNYTMSQWEGILKRMSPNANLTAEEESSLVAYIREHARN